MEKFQHGGDVHGASRKWGVPIEEICDFSANINPLVTENWLKEKLEPYWKEVLHYPDPRYTKLYTAISNHHGLKVDQVVCGNGATALIHQLVATLAPKRARISAPTFAEYEKALLAVGAQVEVCTQATEKGQGFGIDPMKLFEALEGIDMVFLCNPNNPTGHFIQPEEIEAAMEQVPKSTTVVVDEAFIEFTPWGEGASLAGALGTFSNLVILRSATKFYGMPGLRLGYLLSDNVSLMVKIRAQMPIWQLNVLACGLVSEAIRDGEFAEKTRKYVEGERLYLSEALGAVGFKVWPSTVNYMVVRPPNPCDLEALLEPYFILVRSCANYNGGLEGLYRIAIKRHEDNVKLVKAVERIFEKP